MTKIDEIRAQHPGVIEKGLIDWPKYHYFDPQFQDRLVLKDVGESARKY